jgi:acid stress-induced BolA-like protein IbaG/YrbA
MDPKEIQRLIAAGLPGAEVEVVDEVGDGNHFRATIVAPQFAGKTLVQRHQMVYATLGDAMRDRIHALSIGAYTPEEWERRSGAAQPAAISAARD